MEDQVSVNERPVTYGASWGIASLFLGTVPCVMWPTSFQMALMARTGFRGLDMTGAHWASISGYFVVGSVLLLAIIGLGVGMLGAAKARRRRESTVLCQAGSFMCLVALLLWAGIMFVWHSEAKAFLRFEL